MNQKIIYFIILLIIIVIFLLYNDDDENFVPEPVLPEQTSPIIAKKSYNNFTNTNDCRFNGGVWSTITNKCADPSTFTNSSMCNNAGGLWYFTPGTCLSY